MFCLRYDHQTEKDLCMSKSNTHVFVMYASDQFHQMRPFGATAWLLLDQIKPIGQLVPVN